MRVVDNVFTANIFNGEKGSHVVFNCVDYKTAFVHLIKWIEEYFFDEKEYSSELKDIAEELSTYDTVRVGSYAFSIDVAHIYEADENDDYYVNEYL